MRAKPVAVTINNCPSNCNNEVIQLDDHDTTTGYSSRLGQGRISPNPIRNNYAGEDEKKSTKQRFHNICLAISCILSCVALVLVCALLFGFIELRGLGMGTDSCSCKSGSLTTERTRKAFPETERKQGDSADHDANKLKRYSEKKQKHMVDEWLHEIQENVTQHLRETATDLIFSVKKFENKTVNRLLEAEKNWATKFGFLTEKIMTNVTESLQKINTFRLVTEKLINETNRKMLKTRDFMISTLQNSELQMQQMNASVWKELRTMKGPRGYNGTQGPKGPPGPQGAQGRQGPRGFTISGCQNLNQTKSVRRGTAYFSKKPLVTKSKVYLNMKCEASVYGKAYATKTKNSFVCKCMHKTDYARSYTCTLKYTQCNLISI